MCKMTCATLDNLYRDSDSFALDEKLSGWMRITDLDNPNNYLKIDANGKLCASIRGVEIPMHYYGRSPSTRKGKKAMLQKLTVTKEVFEQIVESVMNSVKDICYNLSSEIRDRLPRHELLESMCVVFPNYWSLRQPSDFRNKLTILIDQFCKTKQINGVTINGVLDECHLKDQSTRFARTMIEQYDLMRNPREEGSVTKLWTKLAESEVL